MRGARDLRFLLTLSNKRAGARPRISPTIFAMCSTTETFDLVLLMDVIEHVEDCFGFLRSVRQRTKYVVAHIPLDLSVLSLMIDTPMANRRSAGHLHYFTKSTALALLTDTGYTVLDSFYPTGGHFLPQQGVEDSLNFSILGLSGQGLHRD